jgi:ABC-type amino acid transport substrate-binding protein
MNQNAPRGQHVLFTNTIFYSPIYAYARANDHRFDADLNVLNDAQYTLSIMDGEATDAVAKSNYPNAKKFSLPQNSEMSLLYSNVAQGKADVLFSDVPMSVGYMENNPGQLRRVNDTPVLTYTIGIPVSNDEPKLKAMLDSALMELIANGSVKHMIETHDKTNGYFAPDFYYQK